MRFVSRLRPVGESIGSSSRSLRTTQPLEAYRGSEEEKSFWNKHGQRIGVVGIGGCVVAVMAHYGFNWSGLPDEFDRNDYRLGQVERFYRRMRSNISEGISDFTEPSETVLLPDVLPPPYQPPYTLVIELGDLLTYAHHGGLGSTWKYKKRTGVDLFLNALAQHYEIVIFTNANAMDTLPLIEAIDPNQCVLYKLFRDSTKYVRYDWSPSGVHIKDLSKLNRDLKKVIMIDTKREAVQYQPENALVLPKWHGDDDHDLVDLTDMLIVIAQERPEDIRELIKCYTSLEDPLGAYRLRRNQILEKERSDKLESGTISKAPVGGFLSKLLRKG